MRRHQWRTWALATLAALTGAAGLAAPATAAAEQTCEEEKASAEIVGWLMGTYLLNPGNGAQAVQGSTVILSGESGAPLYFEVATSEAALLNKEDIA
ncbi:MAG: hypothetical protein KGJ43_01885, partial [Acidobacteriota bacterium]|nr:hypothetical protein [Acidobacteriota bacterium]